MLRKSDGYFLVELLLSFNILLVACLFFIPLLMDLREQARSLVIEKQAVQLLYEELNSKLIGADVKGTNVRDINGIPFFVYWLSSEEVCVEVEDHKIHKNKWCKSIE